MLQRGAVAAAVLVFAAFLLARSFGAHPSGADLERDTGAARPTTRPTPTLYCEFYNFMHNATTVSFLFAVDPHGSAPRFLEMSTVLPDGTQTAFDKDERPSWPYAIIDDSATITSPDGATRIVLYGLKPSISGVVWTEAGLRSNDYKNLDGKCRQANFGRT